MTRHEGVDPIIAGRRLGRVGNVYAIITHKPIFDSISLDKEREGGGTKAKNKKKVLPRFELGLPEVLARDQNPE